MAKFDMLKSSQDKQQDELEGFDEKGVKAKVAFGYDTDILPYTNYHFLASIALLTILQNRT